MTVKGAVDKSDLINSQPRQPLQIGLHLFHRKATLPSRSGTISNTGTGTDNRASFKIHNLMFQLIKVVLIRAWEPAQIHRHLGIGVDLAIAAIYQGRYLPKLIQGRLSTVF